MQLIVTLCCTALQVANYCVTKLAELNVPLSTHAVGLSPDSQQPPANGHQYLELTCNGLVGVGGVGVGGGGYGGGHRVPVSLLVG
jgi:hypothetical protein